MAQMVKRPYTGEALKSFYDIVGNRKNIINNKIYLTNQGACFYVNSKNWLHILKIERLGIINDKKFFVANDYMLTKENTLKYSSERYRGQAVELFRKLMLEVEQGDELNQQMLPILAQQISKFKV